MSKAKKVIKAITIPAPAAAARDLVTAATNPAARSIATNGPEISLYFHNLLITQPKKPKTSDKTLSTTIQSFADRH